MIPMRTTQPYRKTGGRAPGPALSAMLAGKPMYLPNPQDVSRALALLAAARRRAQSRG